MKNKLILFRILHMCYKHKPFLGRSLNLVNKYLCINEVL